MPRGDRSGPAGAGPMTGRGVGYCAGYPVPGCANPGPGNGYGRGYGRSGGRGMAWRRSRGGAGYPATYGWVPPAAVPADASPETVTQMSGRQEQQALEQQVVALQAQLNHLQEQLQALSAEPEQEDQPGE